MNKKLIISLSTIAAIAMIVIGATTAYFSNTETSTGNTFIAGAIDLKIDNECHLNGRVCECGENRTPPCYWDGIPGIGNECDCTWGLSDLDGEAIFNFADVKPGDDGEDTISLHVDTNPAWVCAEVSNVTQYENGCNPPELKAEQDEYNPDPETCGDAGEGQGELWNNLTFSIWMDDNCDNIPDPEELPYLVENANASDIKWPIADSQTGGSPIRDACIGVAWSVPDEVGNIIQSDSVRGDITFSAYQSRNNMSFLCNPPVGPVCGNNIVEIPETCELPLTANNPYCEQTTSDCDGNKTITRGDGLGNCDGICGCVDDPWGPPVCVVGSCNATCATNTDCPPSNTCNTETCLCEYVPSCGNGILDPNEQCDDGNNTSGDGCSAVCIDEYCGDGIINDVNETCDDSNTTPYDGCGATCQTEAQLTVVKVMDNGDGGNNVAGDFQLYVGGSPVNSGQAYWYTPGAHVVSETGVSGYAALFSDDCDVDGNVTLVVGDPKTCTLTNDDIKPNITLYKSVINNNGGTAGPADFSMRIDGVLVPSGTSKLVTANAAHTITEDAKAGYHFENISGSPECPAVLGGTATLNEGQAITCTITNDDNP